MNDRTYPRIKICGLTRVDEAEGCAKLGADAIGLVFFPKSPRHVTDEQALAISTAVLDKAKTVGVFVNASHDEILQKAEACRLSAVQLHGQESPDLVRRLSDAGLSVIKALFVDGTPSLSEADDYEVSAFLVECSKGPLPGGNAMEWNWGAAKEFGQTHPLILAGGLSPENVSRAVSSARPLAVDVSSGVEASPGRKDLKQVSAFIRAVQRLPQRHGHIHHGDGFL
jgi:phosphoribosylanthranilate isomerase